MKKGTIKGIVNDKEFIWFSLKSDDVTLEQLDLIAREMDEEYHEGIIRKKKPYSQFIPKRCTHYNNNKVYAISIFNKDLVDFILFKGSSVFSNVSALIDKNFKFIKPKRTKKKNKS